MQLVKKKLVENKVYQTCKQSSIQKLVKSKGVNQNTRNHEFRTRSNWIWVSKLQIHHCDRDDWNYQRQRLVSGLFNVRCCPTLYLCMDSFDQERVQDYESSMSGMWCSFGSTQRRSWMLLLKLVWIMKKERVWKINRHVCCKHLVVFLVSTGSAVPSILKNLFLPKEEIFQTQ